MIRGIVSIGTNSTRMLVAELGGPRPHVIEQRSIGTRIGEGLRESGRLGDEPVRRTLDALREHIVAIRCHTTDVAAIATSAVRRADNAAAFCADVRAITGAELDVIGGEEEARCSFLGAASMLDHAERDRIGVADVGGGSTEYATGRRRDPHDAVSCEIGAVRLTEQFHDLSGKNGAITTQQIGPARDRARTLLEPIARYSPVDRLVFVGGSATTAAALLRRTREAFERCDLTRDELQSVSDLLCARSLEERRTLPGMNPQRADILLAGLIVLDTIFDLTRSERATISMADLLLGYLLSHSKDSR